MSNVITEVEPFRTQNRQLAIALISAGCQLAPQTPETRGPAMMLYTLGLVRQYQIVRGKPFEKAVQELVNRKIPGTVTYFFVRNELLERCIKAWDDSVDEMQRATEQKREPILPDYEPEQIMRTLHMGAVNAKVMIEEVPWFNTPLLSTATATQREVPINNKSNTPDQHAPGSRKVIEGKDGTIWSLGASRKLKDKLKIK